MIKKDNLKDAIIEALTLSKLKSVLQLYDRIYGIIVHYTCCREARSHQSLSVHLTLTL